MQTNYIMSPRKAVERHKFCSQLTLKRSLRRLKKRESEQIPLKAKTFFKVVHYALLKCAHSMHSESTVPEGRQGFLNRISWEEVQSCFPALGEKPLLLSGAIWNFPNIILIKWKQRSSAGCYLGVDSLKEDRKCSNKSYCVLALRITWEFKKCFNRCV